MAKTGNRTRAMGRAGIANWISDNENQRKWNGQLKAVLKRDYSTSDSAISTILSDDRLSERCATRLRFYVDKEVTLRLNVQTKARGVKHRKELEVALAGFRVASALEIRRGNQKLAADLDALADEYLQELGRCRQAFATKRRGRDRDHGILDECHSFLESSLQQPVTHKTLANLVNAGYEVDGNLPKEPITEEQIRKNLAHFKQNNPAWRNDIDPRLHKLLPEPETK
jgi:hypothetical protein